MTIKVTELINRQNVFMDIDIDVLKYNRNIEYVLLIYKIVDLQSKLYLVVAGNIEHIISFFNDYRHLWLTNEYDVYIEINEF